MNQMTLAFIQEATQLDNRLYQLKRMIATDLYNLIMSRIPDLTKAEVKFPFECYFTKEEQEKLPEHSVMCEIVEYIGVLFDEAGFDVVWNEDCE